MKKETLCWKCSKACGDCSWSDHWQHKPVEGWRAIPTKINTDFGQNSSYIVIECPEFVQGRQTKKEKTVDLQTWMEIALSKSLKQTKGGKRK